MIGFDFFASQIQLRFQGNRAYRTPIGQFFTFLIISIVTARLIVMVNTIYNRTEPVVLYKERQIESPRQFTMNNKTLPFAFGMEDGITFQNFIDPSIYTVVAYQQTKNTIVNSQGVSQEVWTRVNATVQRCTEQNFQNPLTKNGFLKLPINDLYCIQPQLEQVIEGDFIQETFSQFIIEVYPCQGQGCGDVKKLGKGYFTIYFQDIVVDPEDDQNPFKFFNRDLFWTTSIEFTQQAIMYFRNNYIYSDYGWIFQDIKKQSYISYSSQEVSLTFGTPYFLQLVMRFEKQKESVYTRSYLKLNDIFSQMGGFFQTMMAIGFILCGQISNLMLNKSIINQAFNFQLFNNPKISSQNNNQCNNLNNKQNESNEEISKFDKIQQNSYSINPILQSPNFQQKNSQNLLQDQLQKQQKSLILQNQSSQMKDQQEKNPDMTLINQKNESFIHSQNQSPMRYQKSNNQIFLSQIIQRKKANLNKEASQGIINDNKNVNQDQSITKARKSEIKQDDLPESITNKKFKQLFQQETNSMQLNIWEYIKYFFWPFGQIKKKKQIIDYSIQKLYYHIDLIYLVKKLIEIEKLKQLLMDSNQIKLFEYLPKPTIKDDDVFKIKKGNKEDQDQSQQEYNILYQDDRSEIEKLQDAYQAYLNIQKRGQKNQLDQKLLSNLDPQLLNLFNYKNDQEEEIQEKQNHQKQGYETKQQKQIPQRDRSESKLKFTNKQKYLEDEKFIEMFSNCSTKNKKLINKINEDKQFDDLDTEVRIPMEAINQNKIFKDYFQKKYLNSLY
ncbi:transmembrane protein, putative (macronuclear) [Tetrahymena thermophila SB210]|uniref:Transmembrane protein, putative n=1 Tax=Tetrahymena thermophila (strain SB210) TaxID=312017 RepID=I7M6P4_TETTS|nr:transmembrane protein, putative [Tetrahymena thermophila SB210]EAR85581.2 transmembrane protein, putative [Tetrahymena thermophila SB210]|eukprot:XP_001033244.2 transmembrane protein, putative [Tetrahymena thermophila SB210]